MIVTRVALRLGGGEATLTQGDPRRAGPPVGPILPARRLHAKRKNVGEGVATALGRPKGGIHEQ